MYNVTSGNVTMQVKNKVQLDAFLSSGWVLAHPDSFAPVAEEEKPSKKLYSEDELASMTAKQIKEIATELGITIKKTLKADIIKEFLKQQ